MQQDCRTKSLFLVCSRNNKLVDCHTHSTATLGRLAEADDTHTLSPLVPVDVAKLLVAQAHVEMHTSGVVRRGLRDVEPSTVISERRSADKNAASGMHERRGCRESAACPCRYGDVRLRVLHGRLMPAQQHTIMHKLKQMARQQVKLVECLF